MRLRFGNFNFVRAVVFCSALQWGWTARAAGEVVFFKHCVSCHGRDGKGNTPAGKKFGAKDLTVSKTSAAEIEKQISEGKREGNGAVKMPPFAGKVSSEEKKELVEYVLKLRK